jgi:uncharacterized protein (TIGR03067 family)
MPGVFGGGGNPFAAFDGAVTRAFLHVTGDRAIYSLSGQRITFRLKLADGTLDWTIDEPGTEQAERKGIYVFDGNQLRLHFGQDAGPRPKTSKDASETWTLTRQPSRQEIYQKLDRLQGVWDAVSGEFNGEALLPRELVGVQLTIANDRWQMSPLQQPAQPDAVPADFFGKQYRFVLDAVGPRSVMMLHTTAGKSIDVRILYELKGDELKLCWNTRRGQGRDFQVGREDVEPVDRFATTPGSDRVLFVLRRGQVAPAPMEGANAGAESRP